MCQSSNADLLYRLKASIRKSSQRSFNKVALLGVVAATWTVPSAALAQSQVDSNLLPQTDCYVEWTVGDRTSLESICKKPAASPQPSRSQTSSSASRQTEAATSTQNAATAVEVISEADSTVYVNGVRISERSQPSRQLQPSLNPSIDIDETTYFQYPQANFSRRYVQYQRFCPYQQPEEHKPQTERYPDRSLNAKLLKQRVDN